MYAHIYIMCSKIKVNRNDKMMRIVSSDQFRTSRWKNGGGLTHEIAKEEDTLGLVWRLSVAEVASDGPFSSFPGLTRILTVIDGAGLDLVHADGTIKALPLTPVRFSGALPIEGRLIGGKILDFNAIFDETKVKASVAVLRSGDGFTPEIKACGQRVLYCIAGEMQIEGQHVAPGDAAFFDTFPTRVVVSENACALLVMLQKRG